MTTIDKLKSKFKLDPESVKYFDLERILGYFGFEKIYAKGSHIKFKHSRIEENLIIPVHNNECKDCYKKIAKKFIDKISKYYE